MTDVLAAFFSVSVLASAIRIGTPLLLAAVGEMVAERSGTLNLGLEGLMTIGAFAGFATTSETGSLWLGILAAVAASTLLAAMLSLLVVTVKVDQVVAGLALNLFAVGLSFYLLRAMFDSGGTEVPSVATFKRVDIPVLSDLPVVGEILFSQHWLTYVAVLLCVGVWFVLNRTVLGLELRSVGHNPEACDMSGIRVHRLQHLAMLFVGGMSGLAGGFLSLFSTGLFFPAIVAGRGWIALAIVIFGNWRLGRIMAGALFFGFLEAYQLSLQSRGINVPNQLLLAMPFVVTIVALVLNRSRSRQPLALGVPYLRGQR